MRKYFSLYKPLLITAIANKYTFVFNIIFPIITFIYSNFNIMFSNIFISKEKIIEDTSYYFAYIIFTTILNSIILQLVYYRENDHYKFLFFLTKSKWTLLISILSVQVTILLIEILLFDLVVMFIVHRFLLFFIFSSLISTIILIIPVFLLLSLLLVFKIKVETISICTIAFIFIGFSIVNIRVKGMFLNLILLFNPIKYLSIGFEQIGYFFGHSMRFSHIYTSQIILITILYLLIGIYSISRYAIRSISERG